MKKKKLYWFLVLVTITIWGIIILKIVQFFANKDEYVIETPDNLFYNKEVNSENLSIGTLINYIELERDPFTFSRTFKNESDRPINSPNVESPLRNNDIHNKIEYRINGVIINPESKLVIFEDVTNNKTLFLKEGDVYYNIVIKEIGKRKIVINEGNQLKEVFVQ